MSVDWTAVVVALIDNGFVIIMMILTSIVFPYLLGLVKDIRLRNAFGILLGNVASIVTELQVSTVEALKAGAEDGKLTAEDISMLKDAVIAKAIKITPDKMLKTIEDSKVDLTSYILEHLEDFVKTAKE